MKQKSDFQEFLKLVREFAARATTVTEIDTVLAHLDAFEHNLVSRGLSDSETGDKCRKARRILNERRSELLLQALHRQFK